MSQIVKTKWECAACKTMNEVEIKKPNVLIPVMGRTRCSECQSTFLIQFLKEPGKHQVKYSVIKYELTAKGKVALDAQSKTKQNAASDSPTSATKE